MRSTAPLPVTMRFKQAVQMRDGAELLHDLYLPGEDGAYPALWMRTPYSSTTPIFVQLARHLASHGYAVIIQNVRGRAGSAGELEFDIEPLDAQDTMAWMAEQPWFSGELGLFGSSYQIYLAYSALSLPAPEGVQVKAVAALAALFDPRDLSRGGVIPLHWALPWALMLRQSATSQNRRRSLADWHQVFSQLPLEQAVDGSDFSGEFWRRLRRPETFAEMPWAQMALVPTLHISGWFDFLLDTQMAKYQELVDVARANGCAERHRLILGAWDHQSMWHPLQRRLVAWTPPDDLEFGQATDLDLLTEIRLWFDRWIKGDPEATRPAVSYFKLRENRWHEASEWPPTGQQGRLFYLDRSAEGENYLTEQVPTESGCETYEYDPTTPTPTLGGAIWEWSREMAPGPQDQRPLHDRLDLLVYKSRPLARALDLTGEAWAELFVATSAPDTDFTVKLLDITPDGRALYVHDGIGRLSAQPDFTSTENFRLMRLRISIGHCAYRFAAGHRVGVEIASSSFPKWDRNRNVGAGAPADAVAVAQQTVFFGGDCASRIWLPGEAE
jgi:putative CocE/NonD family hydrolase